MRSPSLVVYIYLLETNCSSFLTKRSCSMAMSSFCFECSFTIFSMALSCIIFCSDNSIFLRCWRWSIYLWSCTISCFSCSMQLWYSKASSYISLFLRSNKAFALSCSIKYSLALNWLSVISCALIFCSCDRLSLIISISCALALFCWYFSSLRQYIYRIRSSIFLSYSLNFLWESLINLFFSCSIS